MDVVVYIILTVFVGIVVYEYVQRFVRWIKYSGVIFKYNDTSFEDKFKYFEQQEVEEKMKKAVDKLNDL